MLWGAPLRFFMRGGGWGRIRTYGGSPRSGRVGDSAQKRLENMALILPSHFITISFRAKCMPYFPAYGVLVSLPLLFPPPPLHSKYTARHERCKKTKHLSCRAIRGATDKQRQTDGRQDRAYGTGAPPPTRPLRGVPPDVRLLPRPPHPLKKPGGAPPNI